MTGLLRLAFHVATAVSAVLLALTVFMAIAGRCTAPSVTLATNRRVGGVITLHREYVWAAGRGMALVVLEAKSDPLFPDELRWLESVPTFQVVLSPANGDGSRYELYRAAARDEFGLVITPVQAFYDDGMEMSGVLFPSIVPVILFSLLPSLAVLGRVLKRLRRRPGFCRSCGYDVRGTPDRCPECGTVPDTRGTA